MRRIQIKQPPGEKNALGSIKFMFPNPYAVYLHDTPSKSLFQRDYRALSHGCMRVMNPWDFAASLLTYDPNVSAAGLKKLVGGPQTQVNLTQPIPVHITYFTAWVDDSGKLQLRADIYHHDARDGESLRPGLLKRRKSTPKARKFGDFRAEATCPSALQMPRSAVSRGSGGIPRPLGMAHPDW